MSQIVKESYAVTMICPNPKVKQNGCLGERCHGWSYTTHDSGCCGWMQMPEITDEQLTKLSKKIIDAIKDM